MTGLIYCLSRPLFKISGCATDSGATYLINCLPIRHTEVWWSGQAATLFPRTHTHTHTCTHNQP